MTYFPRRIGVGLGEGVIKLSSVKTWPFSSHCCHPANHRDALKHQDTVPKWIILQSFTKLEERPSHPCHILRIEFELNRFLVLLLWDFRQHVPWPVCLTGAVCWNQSPKWFRGRKRQKKSKHNTELNFIADLSTEGAAACLIKPIDLCLTSLLWRQWRIAWGSVQSPLNPEKPSTLHCSLPNWLCNCVIVQRHQIEIKFSRMP